MAGMRHILVHDYFQVNWASVYQTAREDIPALNLYLLTIFHSIPPEE